jgi:hypothetical protein
MEVERDVFAIFNLDELFIFFTWVGDVNELEVVWDITDRLFEVKISFVFWSKVHSVGKSFWAPL